MAKKNKKAGGKTPDTYTVDFTGVEEGRKRPRYPEGDYIAKIKKMVPGTQDDGDKRFVAVTFEFSEGKLKGREITEYYWITQKALWRLRALLEAVGVSVPSKAVKLPFGKMIGKEVGITVADDEYENRIKSVVSDVMEADVVRSGGVDDEDEDILDDMDEDEDEEDEDEDEEDLDEMDRDELKSYIKKNKLDVKVTKTMKDSAIRTAIKAEEEDEGEDDELEEVDLEGL